MTKSIARKRNVRWTERSPANYQARLALDFITLLEERMASIPMNRKDLAEKLGVTQGAVSQKLNNPDNLELKTIIAYAKAVGMDVAIVPYRHNGSDTDGPVNAELFAMSWEKLGKPKSFLAWKSITNEGN